MTAEYIVLRDLSPTRGSFEFTYNVWDPGGRTTRSGPQMDPPQPHIDVVKAEPRNVAELSRDTNAVCVARAMPVALIEPMEAPPTESDDGPGPTWGVSAVGADKSQQYTGRQARVAVIDSGIQQDHAAFPPSEITIIGQDFTGSGDFHDHLGHGTHCAATILGRDVKGRRIGVATGVKKLFVARIFAPGVETSTAIVTKAMRWAIDQGANVISMSLSFNFTGLAADLLNSNVPPEAATAQALVEFQNNLRLFDSLADMLRAQEMFSDSQGVVLVGAAGNHSKREASAGQQSYVVPVAAPSNAFGFLSVGALRRTRLGLGIAPFSNSSPTLVAPGYGVLSAGIDPSAKDTLVAKNGTSMACPHVAGLAALWWDAVIDAGGPNKASEVATRLRASGRIDALVPGLRASDRGSGMPSAPPEAQ